MRVMLIVRGNKDSEAGVLPDEKSLAAMAQYNEELVRAGVLLAADGLRPTKDGALARFTGGKVQIIDGPFSESKEVVAGYWVIQVKSREEALAWVKRVPFSEGGEIEIRPLYELSDFPQGDAVDHHARVQEAVEKQAAKRR